MKIIQLTPTNLEKYRHALLPFVKRYCKNVNSYRWIYQLRKHHLNKSGTEVILALWEGKVISIYALSEYGTKNSLFLISPQYEDAHIGTKLLEKMRNQLGVCYLKINIKAPEQIKMALNAGYVSFSYEIKENEDIFLWFGAGQWHINDITPKEAASDSV